MTISSARDEARDAETIVVEYKFTVYRLLLGIKKRKKNVLKLSRRKSYLGTCTEVYVLIYIVYYIINDLYDAD